VPADVRRVRGLPGSLYTSSLVVVVVKGRGGEVEVVGGEGD
jgi:hypothetical protein